MKWAKRCFSSLRNSSVPVHAIVVDNGSTDGTQDFIKNNFPEVDFIQSSENLGFGKANNIGIEKAYKEGADFFYLMNQDAWLFTDTVSKLLHFCKTHPQMHEIGIVSPIHLDGTENKIEIFVERYMAHNALKQRIFSDLLLKGGRVSYEIDFINAAHWFIPKQTVEKVGGFNPYFYHYGEDNEFVNRLRYKELKIFLLKDCFAVHDSNQDLSKINYQKYTNTIIDIKILDPNYKNAEVHELNSLRKSIFKNWLTGNFAEAKNLKAELKRLKKQIPQLRESKKTLTTASHAFLNI